MEIEFHPVDRDSWKEFEELFESKGAPHYCWCSVWRDAEAQTDTPTKAEKKASMKRRIFEGTPVGILAYTDEEPIAWCSIAPRETYRKLGGDQSKKNMWSLVCFFIKRRYRGQGLSKMVIKLGDSV